MIFNLIDLKNISRPRVLLVLLNCAHAVCEIVFPMIDKVTIEQQGDGEESEDQDTDSDVKRW